MKRNTDINSILRPLSEAPTQAYISDALQVADILEWIISQRNCLGGANLQNQDLQPLTVRQSTFSISEEFLRRMYYIKKRHPARFIVIIDRKAIMKTVQLWRFISNVYDEVYISDNHSKILLVSSTRHGQRTTDNGQPMPGIAMVTSQNLTRGNRSESSVISSDPQVYTRLLDDFNQLITLKSAPMHELMPVNKFSKTNHDSRHINPAPDCGVTEGSAYQTEGSTITKGSKAPASLESEIQRLAALFVPISDIAVILELDPMELRERIADPDSPESIAYRRGKAMAKVRIRAQEMELAACGSPLGLQSVRDNLLTMENDED